MAAVASSTASYEEIRRQRLEENHKRMEELNLLKLSKLLTSVSPKPSPGKQLKPKTVRKALDLSSVRRSSRMADKPQPDYREGLVEPLEGLRRLSYKRRDLSNRVDASYELRVLATDRALSLEEELGTEFPIFVKPMLQSHVTGGFWLGLPRNFCSIHMPTEDEFFTLEDEEGNKSLSKYLGKKNGLSGGWRGFAIDHELVDGDALVFQLVNPTKFKVYIRRVNECENGNRANEVANGVSSDDVNMLNSSPETEPKEVAKPSQGTRRSKRLKSGKN